MNREEALRALVEQWAGQDDPTGYGPDFDAGRDSALYRCRNQIRAILDASPWIPVAERLPEDGRRCWVWMRNRHVGGSAKFLGARRGRVWSIMSAMNCWVSADTWTPLLWQYEIVPADPCREETP